MVLPYALDERRPPRVRPPCEWSEDGRCPHFDNPTRHPGAVSSVCSVCMDREPTSAAKVEDRS